MRRLSCHHIGRRHAPRRIREGRRPAPAAVADRVCIRPEDLQQIVSGESGGPAHIERQHPVPSPDALASRLHQRVRRQHRPALERAAIGEHAHDPRQIAGGRVHVGGRNLDRPPFGRAAPPGRRTPVEEGRRLDRVDGPQIGRFRRLPHLRHPPVLGFRQADPEIQAGEVLAQGRAHGPAVDEAEQLAGQIADDDGAVARGRTRRPHRRLGAQASQGRLAVEPDGRVLGRVEARQASLMAHHPADGDPVLARLSERRPVAGDRCLIVQQAPLDARGDQQRHHSLSGREYRRQRPLVERDRSGRVSPAAP